MYEVNGHHVSGQVITVVIPAFVYVHILNLQRILLGAKLQYAGLNQSCLNQCDFLQQLFYFAL